MPTLKQLTCCLEWMSTGAPLDEFKTKYRDGQVETNVAVPEDPMPFAIHLTSRGYIAPGLAMFVYIDGEYQCNRNRHNLRIPDGTTKQKHTEIDFRVRQKEVMLTDGSVWGKPWRFEKIMVVPDHTEKLANSAPYDGDYLGTIEVVVLRCSSDPQSDSVLGSTGPVTHLPRYEANSKRAMMKSAAGGFLENAEMLDGAVDTDFTRSPQQVLGLDGHWDEEVPINKPHTNQLWGWEMTGSETGEFKPVSQGQYDSTKSSSKCRSSERQSRADDRVQGHASQIAPAGSPAVIINTAGIQTQVRPTVRSVAQSNHSSGLPRGRKKPDEKGGKTSNDWGGEAWNVPLPSTEASNADWKKSHRDSDAISEIDWSSFDSKKDNKTAEWVKSLGMEDKDEAHDTDNNHAYWDNRQSSRARRNTINSQSRVRNESRGRGKQWGQGVDRNTNYHNSSGDWGGPNGSAKKDNEWNADKTWNATSRQPSWEKEPKQTSSPVRTTASPGGAPTGQVSPKSPRLRNNSQLTQAFPGAWPRSRTPSPARQEQTLRWSSPLSEVEQPQTQPHRQQQTHGWPLSQDTVERPETQPARRGQTHRWASPQDAAERPQTQAVQSSWAAAIPEVSPIPKVSMEAVSPNYHNPTGWPNISPNVPADMLHHPGNQVTHTLPATIAASRKLSVSKSMSRLVSNSGSASKTASPPRARSMSTAQLRANSAASHNKSSNLSIDKLISELNDSRNLRPVFDPNETDSPLYTVPEEVVKRKNVTHQVNAGRTTTYVHKLSTPKYMDSHDNPYAVFVFRYRSKAALERMLNTELIESEESERQRLMGLSKDELIERYLVAKADAESKAHIGDSDQPAVASDKLHDTQLSREAEEEAPKGIDPAWGDWAATGQTAMAVNNTPSWIGNDEEKQNHINSTQGNSGQSWGGDDGRARSRSTNHRSEHGGSGSIAWGGSGEMNQNHSDNGNGNGRPSWGRDNGRNQSRSTHHRSEHNDAGNDGNGPFAWGGDNEVEQNHSHNATGNGDQFWGGDNGRDRSRSTHQRSGHCDAGNGGNAPLAWGGGQGRNQSQSGHGNTTAFRSAELNHGRDSSRDTNHRQNQGSGWAGDRDQSWGEETANNGRRGDDGRNNGPAEVDW